MNIGEKNEGHYSRLDEDKFVNRSNQINKSMVSPHINTTLLDKTLYEESFEKLEETMLNQKEEKQSTMNSDIPLIDKITLGPLEKYQKYNRYPYKMIVHILLVIMTTIQVLATIQTDTGYSRTQNRFLSRTFIVPEGTDDDMSDPRERYIYTPKDLRLFIQNSIYNYYHLNELSLEKYEYLPDKSSVDNIQSVKAYVHKLEK